jgi:hypothetical protein
MNMNIVKLTKESLKRFKRSAPVESAPRPASEAVKVCGSINHTSRKNQKREEYEELVEFCTKYPWNIHYYSDGRKVTYEEYIQDPERFG